MSNFDFRATLEQLHTELRLKRLSPLWAKLEILLGLVAASTGLLLGIHATSRPAADILWPLAAASLLLQTLGLYLALAGHRSHLYQSQNKLIAWLASRQR
jgi:hypothetical protein